jgi:hypothetical protein
MSDAVDQGQPFRHTPLSRVGTLIHALLGPSETTVKEGPPKSRRISIRTDASESWPQATVHCVRSVYRTRYKRFWIPNVHRTLYTVSIVVDPEVLERYGEAPFAPVTFPLLCNPLLQWTTYPHLVAIFAFLDGLIDKLGGSIEMKRRIRI